MPFGFFTAKKTRSKSSDYFQQHMVPCGEFSDGQSWVVLSSTETAIRRKIEDVGVPLKDWDVNIYRGLLTGLNEAFIIDEQKRQEILNVSPEAEAIIRPILRGRDIKRYQATFKNLWLINTHNGQKNKNIERVNAETYQSVYEHLSLYRTDLERRQDKGDHWTNLRNCAYLDELEKEKIIWIELTDHANFFLDSNGYYVNNTVAFMTGKRLKYITGFLNSKVCDWYFSTIAATSGVGTTRWFKIYVEQISVPDKIDPQLESRIAVLVEDIQHARLAQKATNSMEQEIEAILHSVLGLSEEEVGIVENWSP